MIPPHYRKHGETVPTTGLLQHDALVKYLNLSDDVYFRVLPKILPTFKGHHLDLMSSFLSCLLLYGQSDSLLYAFSKLFKPSKIPPFSFSTSFPGTPYLLFPF